MRIDSLLPILLLVYASAPATAETLRYSGALMDDGAPAEGRYAFRMSLYDAAVDGGRLGPAITLVDIPVSSGRFTADVEFGLPPPLLEKFWMQVEVAGPDGAFEVLGERMSLDSKALATAGCWNTEGNAGLQFSTDFLGTTDPVPLVLRTNNERAMQFVPFIGGVSIVAGYSGNEAAGIGATISGGGLSPSSPEFAAPAANRVLDSFGTVGGGFDNEAGFAHPTQPTTDNDAHSATVSGGAHNRASATYAAIAGGESNVASGIASAIGGGRFNEASGAIASVSGGVGNIASGAYATIAGGSSNLAGGANSFAAGNRAKVRVGDDGTFVWADNQAADFTSGGTDVFLVRARGGVGLNLNNPRSALHVRHKQYDSNAQLVAVPDPGSVITAERDSGNVFISIIGSATSQRGILFGEPENVASGAITYDNNGTAAMEFRTNGNFTRMRIDADGTTRNITGAWSTLSDARVKRGIEDIVDPLATLLSLRGHRFEYTEAAPMMAPGLKLGFVAQEVRQALPEWVREGSDGYLSVTPTGFEALAVEAMRELAAENGSLRQELAGLRALVVDLQSRFAPEER
jgi:hypothetical protein